MKGMAGAFTHGRSISVYLILLSDEEDETAELLRELEKIKRERAEQREREV
jgi:hypothetical protein